MISIVTTSDSDKVLKNIASEILKQKLSPCTHIYKINQSGYIWKNKIVHKVEFRLEIKTIIPYKNKISSIIKGKHNYKVYELYEFQLNSLNSDYDNWLMEQLK